MRSAALILLMAIGSVAMWIGVPLGLIYGAAQLAGASGPSAGPYVLVIVGLPIGMAVVGTGLGYLDRVHARVTGRVDAPHRAPWLRSLRGERAPAPRGGVLDRVMIVSVALALLAFAVWFFGFAGSSLPSA
ncbi:MAG TPA: hypothetical protein VNS09_02085 [Solirubrobacter sp.]|nr:hypothetical protein [Solirubrobacter sp.]